MPDIVTRNGASAVAAEHTLQMAVSFELHDLRSRSDLDGRGLFDAANQVSRHARRDTGGADEHKNAPTSSREEQGCLNGTLGVIRSWRYYAVAVAAPAVSIAAVVFVDHVFGLGRFAPSRSLALAVPTVVFIGGALGLPLALGEEYGWRGYLLQRLLPLGEIKATLIVGLIWTVWRLPILLIGLNYPEQSLVKVLPVFGITVLLMAFPFTWLYMDSRASVIAVALMHSVLNATGDTFTSSRYLDGNPLVVSAGCLVAAAILLMIVLIGGALRYRKRA